MVKTYSVAYLSPVPYLSGQVMITKRKLVAAEDVRGAIDTVCDRIGISRDSIRSVHISHRGLFDSICSDDNCEECAHKYGYTEVYKKI